MCDGEIMLTTILHDMVTWISIVQRHIQTGKIFEIALFCYVVTATEDN